MMDAVRTSETSVDNYFTRQYIPEDNSELQTRLCRQLYAYVTATSPLNWDRLIFVAQGVRNAADDITVTIFFKSFG
jgi:hypothetical protein